MGEWLTVRSSENKSSMPKYQYDKHVCLNLMEINASKLIGYYMVGGSNAKWITKREQQTAFLNWWLAEPF